VSDFVLLFSEEHTSNKNNKTVTVILRSKPFSVIFKIDGFVMSVGVHWFSGFVVFQKNINFLDFF
jgi:hypothetical protein